MNNEELEALLADAHDGDLDPDAAANLPLLADLLADPATWEEPSPDLKDAVLRTVAGAPPAAEPKRRRGVLIGALAVAAAIVIALGVFAAVRSSSNPDYTAKLSASGAISNVHASADVTKSDAGFRVTLSTSGLDELPPGEYYQAWLKNAAGQRVPLGTFSSSNGDVTLWSGVAPTEYPTMTVTIEHSNGAPSTPVLAGPVQPK
jgi:hypothetical protein